MDKIAAVVLVAGKGTRMLPLTHEIPKPMLKIGDKNLIEHKLELLPEEISEIVFVIGYLGEKIREYFGHEWKGKRIQYVVQHEQNGTAGALWAAKEALPSRFVVMNGDDIYAQEDFLAMLTHTFAICGIEVDHKETGGEILLGRDGKFLGMHEEKHFVTQGLVNTGLYMLDERIFHYPPVPIGGSSTEFGLPHTLAILATDIPVSVVRTQNWFQVTAPDDLIKGEEFLKLKTT